MENKLATDVSSQEHETMETSSFHAVLCNTTIEIWNFYRQHLFKVEQNNKMFSEWRGDDRRKSDKDKEWKFNMKLSSSIVDGFIKMTAELLLKCWKETKTKSKAKWVAALNNVWLWNYEMLLFCCFDCLLCPWKW